MSSSEYGDADVGDRTEGWVIYGARLYDGEFGGETGEGDGVTAQGTLESTFSVGDFDREEAILVGLRRARIECVRDADAARGCDP